MSRYLLPLLTSRAKISVLVGPRIGVAVQFKKVMFNVLPCIKQKRPDKVSVPTISKTPYSPPDTHYFKYGHSLVKKLTFDARRHLFKEICLTLKLTFSRDN